MCVCLWLCGGENGQICTECDVSEFFCQFKKTLINQSVHRCVAVCCSVLQCVAVCCNVLQCVAVCCSAHQSQLVRFPGVNLRDFINFIGKRRLPGGGFESRVLICTIR